MEWFNVGKIVNTHGMKGEVRVISQTDFAEERYEVGNKLHIFLPEQQKPVLVEITGHRVHKNFDLLTFEGYYNVGQVVQFKGGTLKVSEDERGDLKEDEYYYQDIIGCHVFTEDEEALGVIKEVLSTGANDVWVVSKEGKRDVLIPYIESVVKVVDIKAKKVVIHVLEGLLD